MAYAKKILSKSNSYFNIAIDSSCSKETKLQSMKRYYEHMRKIGAEKRKLLQERETCCNHGFKTLLGALKLLIFYLQLQDMHLTSLVLETI